MISTTIAIVIATVGTLFMLLAGLGVLRLPDLYCRASATTKAATLGVGCLLIATAVFFQDSQVTTRVLATIAFLLLTAPVAAHMLGRAAYRRGVPLWEGTVSDELAGAETAGPPPQEQSPAIITGSESAAPARE